jgi:hypothetical protein
MSRSLNRISELPEVRWDTGGTDPAESYTLSCAEKEMKIINYRRDPLNVKELHQWLNERSLLETGYSI